MHKNTSLVLRLTLKWSFCVTAFIQSDTILEVLHFDEGRLLQVRPFILSFLFMWIKTTFFSRMSRERKHVCVNMCVRVCVHACNFACILYTSLYVCLGVGGCGFPVFICFFPLLV